MKNATPLLLIILLSLIIAAFPSAAFGEAVLLRLNVKPGQIYRMSLSTSQKTTMDMPDQKMDVVQSSDLRVVYTVDRVEPDGTIDLTCVYEAIRARIKSSFMDAAFDSSAPKKADPSLAKIFKPMVGARLQVCMASNGRVLETKGIKELVSKSTASMTPQQRKNMEKWISGQLTSNLVGGVDEYSEKPVHPGDSWTTQSVVDVSFPVNVRTTYQLKESRDGFHLIEVSSEITSSPGKPDPKAASVPSLKGTQTGTIKVDSETGWPVSSRLIQKISGEMTMQSGKKASTIPIIIENTIVCQSY